MIENMIIPLIYPVFIMFIAFYVLEHFIQVFVYVIDILQGILDG